MDPKYRKLRLAISAIAIIIIGGILIALKLSKNAESSILNQNGLNNLTATQMVDKLDASINEKGIINASVTGEELVIKGENGYTASYDLPEDKFYLSFAPYISSSHPCGIHSVITCRGELKEVTFDITVYDNEDNIIFEGSKTSMKNGFVGIWLDKGIEGRIEVKYGDLSASSPISTFADRNTCLTTSLQLN
jgi:hypothetical protein